MDASSIEVVVEDLYARTAGGDHRYCWGRAVTVMREDNDACASRYSLLQTTGHGYSSRKCWFSSRGALVSGGDASGYRC
jgi:hypothetical protein